MGKLCIIYNFAPRYREAIFKMIDQEYDCDWYFGDNNTDIKGLDLSILQRVYILKNKAVIRYPLYYQLDVLCLLKNDDYSTYLILGDVFCISTWLFIIKAKLFYPNKRIYFWSHGWYGKEGFMKKKLKKFFFRLVDGTFLYGNYAKNLMLKEGFKSSKLFVIHNSLMYSQQIALRENMTVSDIYRKHFNNDNLNLIFIGRLTTVKRLDLLIKALIELKSRGLGFNLTLVGDGVQRQKLQDLVNLKMLSENVWFYGACYDERINANLIFNADLCVAPGNVGLTAIHSMVFGTPVATHNCFKYQMPEFEAIHEGITGTFFDYENVDSIVNAIINWFEMHKNNRQNVRKACYEEIDSYWTPQYQMDVIKQNLKTNND